MGDPQGFVIHFSEALASFIKGVKNGTNCFSRKCARR